MFAFTGRVPLRLRIPNVSKRLLHEQHEAKYLEKLQKRAADTGAGSIAGLKEQLTVQRKNERHRVESQRPEAPKAQRTSSPSTRSKGTAQTMRSDSSPVKPLSSILNLDRVVSASSDQVSSLWRMYHASRSDGTGRGYLCASIPVDLYAKMAETATKYPKFVIPVPRTLEPDTPDSESKTGYEFYFLEWAFHEAPPSPSIATSGYSSTPPKATLSNPRYSTVLFTPLQEFKLRNSFATPYLVLTNYTDLVHTHQQVLLRGEISMSTGTSGGKGGYLLTQEDAQLLSVGLQKFYLPNDDDGGRERQELLRSFHEKPEEFKWEDLLKHSTL